MVIMEAMAAGRLVIATYIAGIPELVREGETGLLVPAGDAHALTDAMQRLAAMSDDDRSRLATAARTRVIDRHDVTREAAKLARLIAR